MRSLLVLRHAKSSWKNPDLADHDRPLNKRGKRDAPRMGQLVRDQRLVPDLILSSTALRARTTALMVAEAVEHGCEVRLLRDLYLADPSDYLRELATLPDRYGSVMVVGHNPGLEDLVETLTGTHEVLPTAALVWIELPIDRWEQIDTMPFARLRSSWRPKEL